MAILDGLQWDMLRDGFQIAMCCVILLCLVWQRRKFRRHLAGVSSTQRPASFSEEVLWQTLRQQTEQSLEVISAAVQAERAKLQPLLDAADVPRFRANSEITAEHVPFCLGKGDVQSEVAEQRSCCDDIHGLAARGFSAREIAGQIQRPIGEVELALRLQRGVC